ncbi:pentapeptide repeat-containing protein [Pendulispora albinea]|uniref:pentapeptide repeat-containing protein n=1 Tax=Pendulispora albinea TaxID=2741071 RepID=UPI00374E0AD9
MGKARTSTSTSPCRGPRGAKGTMRRSCGRPGRSKSTARSSVLVKSSRGGAAGAGLSGARFSGARFSGLGLSGARFSGARFSGLGFSVARFSGARA